jgi:GGDEF domain-containing protein
MVRLTGERVLLIGDVQRQMQAALAQALPGAQIAAAATLFDGIAELSGGSYTAVLAAAEPMERRPEAAVRVLRELAGDGRLILFGQPALELLSRKMMEHGCDDYLVMPADASEIQQIFGRPPLRLTLGGGADAPAEAAPTPQSASAGPPLLETALAEIVLDALLQHPHDAVSTTLRKLNERLGPTARFAYKSGDPATHVANGHHVLAHPVRTGGDEVGTLSMAMPEPSDESASRHALSQLAHLVGKVAALQDRHERLQKLAITDDLTGVYNAMYFRHFLKGILQRAKSKRFPVTLLLFDIDDFKRYNDTFGHGVGDEILKQTAAVMKACTREHDLVARIGGDEFAVVFWDKEGPRQPHRPNAGTSSRPPQTPEQVFERFKERIATAEFPVLGPSGKGALGISGGLAVYPYDAHDVTSLIKEADRRLMQGAKKEKGKNVLYIVGPATHG